jgi:hypothetical protein
MTPDGPSSHRWWLKLQVGYGVAGGLAWLVGAAMEQDFIAGVGCGLLVAALLLRLGRTAAAGEGPTAE